MTKEELKSCLIDEAEYSKVDVDDMSEFELINAWLDWNNIIGYTETIIDVIEASGLQINPHF